MRASLLAIGLAGLLAPAALAEEPFEGRWTAVSAERDGASAPDLLGHRLSFDGDAFRIIDAEGSALYAGTYAADRGATPATIDFATTDGNAPGPSWAGIWRQDGGTLTIVDNAPDPTRPRPTGFSAPAGSGYVMLVFLRME